MTTLTYTVSPSSVYITTQPENPSIATVTIAVSNNTGNDISVNWILFDFNQNDPTLALTTQDTITPSSVPEAWLPAEQSSLQYASQPGDIASGGVVLFTFAGIQVNGDAGPGTITITENLAGVRASTNVIVSKVQPELSVDSFKITPANIDLGQLSTISWETTAASQAFLYSYPLGVPAPGSSSSAGSSGNNQACPPDNNNASVPVSGSCTISPRVSTLYVLQVYGRGPVTMVQQILTVNSPLAELNTTSANINVGQTAYLTWTTANATQVTLNGQPVDAQMSGQGYPVSPTSTTTYLLVASNGSVSAQSSVTIVVSNLNISAFSGSSPAPNQITLTWQVTDADYVQIEARSIGYSFTCGPDRRQANITIPSHVVQYMQRNRISSALFQISATGPAGTVSFDPYTVYNIQLQ